MFSQKAEEHIKNATKAVKTTMFKWKPDWEVAAEVSECASAVLLSCVERPDFSCCPSLTVTRPLSTTVSHAGEHTAHGTRTPHALQHADPLSPRAQPPLTVALAAAAATAAVVAGVLTRGTAIRARQGEGQGFGSECAFENSPSQSLSHRPPHHHTQTSCARRTTITQCIGLAILGKSCCSLWTSWLRAAHD
jgi:hypothetical protein